MLFVPKHSEVECLEFIRKLRLVSERRSTSFHNHSTAAVAQKGPCSGSVAATFKEKRLFMPSTTFRVIHYLA